MRVRVRWREAIRHFVNDEHNELGAPPQVLIVCACIGALYLCYLFAGIWHWYSQNVTSVTPIGAAIGAAVVASAALRQAKTARLRHEEQTKADLQRRLTESFSKAAEQLGNDKLEVRLGGIYTMERISKESPSDYWPVMETLTAFVRERARWKEEEQSVEDDVRTDGLRYPETVLPEIPTDIAAVVSVIVRRDKASIEREAQMGWRFNLQGTDLRGANFLNADLRNASFRGAHLQHAFFARANLERATFSQALLENANFFEAKLENVSFNRAKLQDATFDKANLTRAVFQLANLQGVSFMDAHLEQTHFVRAILINAYFTGAYVAAAEFGKAHLGGADLSGASGLQKEQLLLAQGDDKTRVPEGIDPPENQLWAF